MVLKKFYSADFNIQQAVLILLDDDASGSRPLTKETMGGALEVETIYFDKLKLMNTSR